MRKSQTPLTGRHKSDNQIIITNAGSNVIATYPISELPLPGRSPSASFFQGDLHLTFPNVEAYVANDRERLISSQNTTEILRWVAAQVWEQVNRVEAATRAQRDRSQLERASELNALPNHHTRNFLKEMDATVLSLTVSDP